MSRWRRQQRKRANRRLAREHADKVFGDFLAEWTVKFDQTVKAFGAAMVHAAGAFAKWAAERRMWEALQRESEDECL